MVDRQNRLAGPSPRPEKTAVKLPSRGELSSKSAGYNCFMILTVSGLLLGCAGAGGAGAPGDSDTVPLATPGRGFPATTPWLSFYGSAAQMGDLDSVARTFRIINIDADPDAGNFSTVDIARLKHSGQNRVISYLNLGSCETYRSYWSSAPAGLTSCGANLGAQRGSYQGYPDEVWMDVGNPAYQALILNHVAPRLAARGVDGFFFDNFEIVEHGTATANGPCDSSCRQGGLDLIRQLRLKYPQLLFVMQNATSDVTRLGTSGGIPFPSLLDGISHEEVYAPAYDAQSEAELSSWLGQGLTPGGRPFFIGTEDYVGSCSAAVAAQSAYVASRSHGFSPYATDASGSQTVVCFWPF